jgi:hypothetical protein
MLSPECSFGLPSTVVCTGEQVREYEKQVKQLRKSELAARPKTLTEVAVQAAGVSGEDSMHVPQLVDEAWSLVERSTANIGSSPIIGTTHGKEGEGKTRFLNNALTGTPDFPFFSTPHEESVTQLPQKAILSKEPKAQFSLELITDDPKEQLAIINCRVNALRGVGKEREAACLERDYAAFSRGEGEVRCCPAKLTEECPEWDRVDGTETRSLWSRVEVAQPGSEERVSLEMKLSRHISQHVHKCLEKRGHYALAALCMYVVKAQWLRSPPNWELVDCPGHHVQQTATINLLKKRTSFLICPTSTRSLRDGRIRDLLTPDVVCRPRPSGLGFQPPTVVIPVEIHPHHPGDEVDFDTHAAAKVYDMFAAAYKDPKFMPPKYFDGDRDTRNRVLQQMAEECVVTLAVHRNKEDAMDQVRGLFDDKTRRAIEMSIQRQPFRDLANALSGYVFQVSCLSDGAFFLLTGPAD